MTEYETLREINTLTETMKEQQAWIVLEVACILVILVGMMIIGLCIILFINKTNENTNNLLQYYVELKDEQEKRKTSVSI
jgi:signal transduction histidine kinase